MRSIEDALNSGKKITPGVAALREAGILAGFYEAENQDRVDDLYDKIDELLASGGPIAAFNAAHKPKKAASVAVGKEKLN